MHYLAIKTEGALYEIFLSLDAKVDDINKKRVTETTNLRIIFFFLFLVAQVLAFALLWISMQSKLSAEVGIIDLRLVLQDGSIALSHRNW